MRRMKRVSACLCLMIGLTGSCALCAPVFGQSVLSSQQAAEEVSVGEISSDGDFVSGVVINHSSRTLRDVRLEIHHSWLWNDERRPGSDNPGRIDHFVVPGEIAPGGNERFTYKISPPLPVRADGRFTTRVSVVGFSVVEQ